MLALSAEITEGAANIVVKHGAICLAHRTLEGVRAVRGGWSLFVSVIEKPVPFFCDMPCGMSQSSVHHVANEPESLHAMAVP